MFIALESLFAGGVDRLPLDCEFDFSREAYGGVFPFTTPVRLKGEIRNTAGLITIEAEIKVALEAVCDRCAESINPEFSIPVSHGLVASLNDDENDDYILVEDMRLDIRQLTIEDINFALPSKLLCKPDCKGVCITCGADLNKGSCDCKREIDPRLEALLDLMDN